MDHYPFCKWGRWEVSKSWILPHCGLAGRSRGLETDWALVRVIALRIEMGSLSHLPPLLASSALWGLGFDSVSLAGKARLSWTSCALWKGGWRGRASGLRVRRSFLCPFLICL
jgi:hypothetical protein